MEAFWFILIVLVGATIWVGVATNRRNMARLRALTISHVDTMGGIEFEHYVAKLLVSEGYSGVRVTRASGDRGVDLVASNGSRKYAIQAKRQTGSVSRRAVSDAVAGMKVHGCNAAMVITNSYLTKQADEFARMHGCVVVDRQLLADWIVRFSGTPPSELRAVPREAATTRLQKPASVASDSGFSVIQSISPVAPATQHGTPRPPPPSDAPTTGSERKVPKDILKGILARAKKEYPTDPGMQLYMVNEQQAAYRELEFLRSSAEPTVLARAWKDIVEEYPEDYSMQVFCLKDQQAAYRELQTLRSSTDPAALGEVWPRIAQEFPDDYAMQVFSLKEQLQAHSALKALHQTVGDQ